MTARLTAMLLAGGLLLVHHLFFFYGHFGYDDLYYARLAAKLLEAGLTADDLYAYRIIPLLTTAISYRLLGIGDFSSALPALLCSFGILLLLYRVFRDHPLWQFILAYLGYFGLRWAVFFSDKLMPDIYVSLFVFAGWLAYVAYRFRGGRSEHRGLLAALAFFLAFNSKGSIILLLPLFGSYLVWDLWRGERRFWGPFVAACFGLLSLYFLTIWWVTGSPLSRFTAIAGGSYVNPCSYDLMPWSALLDRWTNGFRYLLRDSGYWVHLGVALVTVLVVVRRKDWSSPTLFWPLTVLIGTLSINFMTISLNSYNPVCLETRHILLFGPIFVVCSVRSLAYLRSCLPVNLPSWLGWGLFLVTACSVLYPTVQHAVYGRSLHYREVKADFRVALERIPRPATVVGSRVTVNYAAYFTDFQDAGLTFLAIEEEGAGAGAVPCGNTYLITGWYPDWHAGTTGENVLMRLKELGYTADPLPYGTDRIQVAGLTCPH
jgi:4-amino-4-deoxy-L-arabinose transferase-like glycosyltransferase